MRDALLVTGVCVSCGEFGVCVSRACSLPLDSTVQPQRKEWLSWSSLKIGNTLPILKTIINRSCALLRLSALCKPRVSSCATLLPTCQATCIQMPLAHVATSTCIVVNARALYYMLGSCGSFSPCGKTSHTLAHCCREHSECRPWARCLAAVMPSCGNTCCVGADWLLGDCTPRIELST